MIENYFNNYSSQQFLSPPINQSKRQSSLIENFTEQLKQSESHLKMFISDYAEYFDEPVRADVMQFVNISRARQIFSVSVSTESILRYVKHRVSRMLKNKQVKKNWSLEDVRTLVWLVSVYSTLNQTPHYKFAEKDWQEISRKIPGSNPQSVMFKWLGLRKNNLCQVQWREYQKKNLIELVKIHGENNWAKISKLLYLSDQNSDKIYRGPKQCREHWNCYLNPKLKKGLWNVDQDYLLISLVNESGGNKKWSHYVKYFGGRTQNALKNRYNLLLDKQMKQHHVTQRQALQIYLETHPKGDINLDKNIVKKKDYYNQGKQERKKNNQQKIIKKKLKDDDKDWLTDLKSLNYLSYKNLSSVSLSQRKPRQCRKPEKAESIMCEKYHENMPIGTDFLSISDILNNSTDQKNNKQSSFQREQKCEMDVQEVSLNGMMNVDWMKQSQISEIKVVQITQQKLYEFTNNIREFIPCQLIDNKLSIYKK